MTIESYILLVCIGLQCYLVYLIVRNIYFTDNKNPDKYFQDAITNFDKRIVTLTYFLELAYNQVYQSDIAALSLSGYSITEKENSILCQKFINSVYTLMGSNMLIYYIHMFGDEETFLNNCLIYFNNELISKNLKTITDTISQKDSMDKGGN